MLRTTFSNSVICQVLFVSNSVTPDKLGAINGLGIAVTSLFRYVLFDETDASKYINIICSLNTLAGIS